MTWIKTIKPRDADVHLREAMRWRSIYPSEYRDEVPILRDIASNRDGKGISDSHSLIPPALYHAFSLLGELLQPELPLQRRQHEMIATVVSLINDCFY
jgi:hypothetical protein